MAPIEPETPQRRELFQTPRAGGSEIGVWQAERPDQAILGVKRNLLRQAGAEVAPRRKRDLEISVAHPRRQGWPLNRIRTHELGGVEKTAGVTVEGVVVGEGVLEPDDLGHDRFGFVERLVDK
ncbi:hypothetical protein D3C77_452200 [compost metagenome]